MKFVYAITGYNNPNDLINLDKFWRAKKYTVKAKCIEKYIGADQMAYCTFELENKEKVSTPVTSAMYGQIGINEEGILYYGTYKMMNIFGSWNGRK